MFPKTLTKLLGHVSKSNHSERLSYSALSILIHSWSFGVLALICVFLAHINFHQIKLKSNFVRHHLFRTVE